MTSWPPSAAGGDRMHPDRGTDRDLKLQHDSGGFRGAPSQVCTESSVRLRSHGQPPVATARGSWTFGAECRSEQPMRRSCSSGGELRTVGTGPANIDNPTMHPPLNGSQVCHLPDGPSEVWWGPCPPASAMDSATSSTAGDAAHREQPAHSIIRSTILDGNCRHPHSPRAALARALIARMTSVLASA